MANKCDISMLNDFTGDKGETERLLKRIKTETDKRVELDPSKSRIKHEQAVIENMIEDYEQGAIREEKLMVSAIAAREELVRSFEDFRQTLGQREDIAVSEAVKASANDVIFEREKLVEQFNEEMREAGLSSFFLKLRKKASRQEKAAVLEEIGEQNKVNGKPGKSGNKQAQQLAEIYQKHFNALRARQDKIGIRTDDLEGYMLRQVWDADSLVLFGSEDDFVRAMLPKINRVRTFGEDVPDATVAKFLREFRKERVKGEIRDVPLTREQMYRERDTFAQRQLRNREIHLLDAEASLFAMENFGQGNVAAAILSAIEGGARKTRMAEVFGPNPRNTVEHLRTVAKAATADDATARKIDNPGNRVTWLHGDPEHVLSNIDGSMEMTTNPTNAMVLATAANLMRARFLGRVALSSVPDVATVERAGARIGVSAAEHTRVRADVLLNRVPKAMRKQMAGAVDTANSYNIGAILNKHAPRTVLAKAANASASMANATLKYGGILMWTGHNKQVAWVMGSSLLSRLIDTPFKDLDKSVKGLLIRGRVSELDWSRLPGVPGAVRKEGGQVWLDTEAITKFDPDLSQRIQAALSSFVDDAVPTPGAGERAIMTQGTRSGTGPGIMFRMAMTFMGYPISMITRQMAREAEAGGGFGLSGQAKLAALVTLAGYGSMAMHDVATGKTRDYLSDDPEVQRGMLLEAMTRGGGGGIFASILLDGARFGSPVEGFMGGAIASYVDGVVGGVIGTVKSTAEGDLKKAAGNAAKTIQQVVPFTDLPYTRILTDELIFEPILQATDPRALRRRKSHWYKRTGGGFIFD